MSLAIKALHSITEWRHRQFLMLLMGSSISEMLKRFNLAQSQASLFELLLLCDKMADGFLHSAWGIESNPTMVF
jgi:hypothetical protein